MPDLIIDHRPIQVPRGTRVIDAAERLGIMIPRFCYLKVLGAVGACRMCAVMFEEGPVKGLEMSCMVKAADGMRVTTSHPEAVDFRRSVIEWLMLNHPHDCPVCDEGGHCLLQDETISGGHGRRRYTGRKRTYEDQDLGPLIRHEMNRCIHCYRCVRFYREYAGFGDLGTMGIASRVFFGRFASGVLESPFAGNLIDICPTGVYTDKPSRYQGRRWHMQRAASVCLHCSLGCNTVAWGHNGTIIRQESRENSRVNGSFICDRGRYGHAYANLAERPRQARLAGRPTDWRHAAEGAAALLKEMGDDAGSSAVAVLGSARNSLETQIILRYLAHHARWRAPRFFAGQREAENTAVAVGRLDSRLATGLAEVGEADCLLAAGADPLQEAPMLALAMRQAARRGARVMMIDPRPIELPFAFEYLPVGIGELAAALAAVVKKAVKKGGRENLGPEEKRFFRGLPDGVQAPGLNRRLAEAAGFVAESRRPVIICGTGITSPATIDLAADLTHLLQRTRAGSRLFYPLAGPNAFGAGLLQQSSRYFPSILRDIEAGEIRALVVAESDPFFHFRDQRRLEEALDQLELLAVFDYLPTRLVERADIFIPTATVFEAGGSFINNSGLLQYAAPVQENCIPLALLEGGSHPPRSYDRSAGPRRCPSVYEALLHLAGGLAIRTPTADVSPWSLLPDEYPDQAELLMERYPADGLELLPRMSEVAPFQAPQEAAAEISPDTLAVLLVDRTFGTEELSCHAEPLEQLAGSPHAFIHFGDATRAGLREGERLRLRSGDEDVGLVLRVTDKMAPGHLVIPRQHRMRGVWRDIPRSVELEELQKMREPASGTPT